MDNTIRRQRAHRAIQGEETSVANHQSPITNYLLIGVCGTIALLFYAAINFVVGQTPEYMAHPRAALIEQSALWSALAQLPLPVPQASSTIFWLVSATAIVTMACYILALWVSRQLDTRRAGKAPLIVVLGFTGLFLLTSFLALPNLDGDLYLYILRARVFTAHEENPYTTPAATFEDDPYLQYGDPSWVEYPESKGPTWTAISIGTAALAGDSMVRQIFAFRTVLLLLNLASAFLIWRILAGLAPGYQLTGLIFYLWNPIVVLRGLQHTEPASLLFLLLGLYLYTQRRRWMGMGSVVVSGLTKFTTGPLSLPYLLFLWKGQSLRKILISSGLLAAGGILILLLLQDGGTLIMRVLGTLFEPERLLFLPGFAAVILWVSWRWRSSLDDLVRAWTAILLWFMLFLSPPEYAWYAIPLIGIACLIRPERIPSKRGAGELVVLTLAVSLSVLTNDLIGQVAKPYVSLPVDLLRAVRFGPAFIVLLWIGMRWLQSRAAPDAVPITGSSDNVPEMGR